MIYYMENIIISTIVKNPSLIGIIYDQTGDVNKIMFIETCFCRLIDNENIIEIILKLNTKPTTKMLNMFISKYGNNDIVLKNFSQYFNDINVTSLDKDDVNMYNKIINAGYTIEIPRNIMLDKYPNISALTEYDNIDTLADIFKTKKVLNIEYEKIIDRASPSAIQRAMDNVFKHNSSRYDEREKICKYYKNLNKSPFLDKIIKFIPIDFLDKEGNCTYDMIYCWRIMTYNNLFDISKKHMHIDVYDVYNSCITYKTLSSCYDDYYHVGKYSCDHGDKYGYKCLGLDKIEVSSSYFFETNKKSCKIIKTHEPHCILETSEYSFKLKLNVDKLIYFIKVLSGSCNNEEYDHECYYGCECYYSRSSKYHDCVNCLVNLSKFVVECSVDDEIKQILNNFISNYRKYY